jgi:hypothetical protein
MIVDEDVWIRYNDNYWFCTRASYTVWLWACMNMNWLLLLCVFYNEYYLMLRFGWF